MVARTITCDVYNEDVLFYANCTARKFLSHLKKKHGITEEQVELQTNDTKTLGLVAYANEQFVFWIKHIEDIASLIHELYHLGVKMFKYKGVPVTAENDEVMAYYMGYWVTRIMNVLKEENVSVQFHV